MITRRTFLKLLGFAPVAAVLPKLPAPPAVAASDHIPYMDYPHQTHWDTFGDDMVKAIHISQDGAVFVGGNFTNAGVDERNYMAAWSGKMWSAAEAE